MPCLSENHTSREQYKEERINVWHGADSGKEPQDPHVVFQQGEGPTKDVLEWCQEECEEECEEDFSAYSSVPNIVRPDPLEIWDSRDSQILVFEKPLRSSSATATPMHFRT